MIVNELANPKGGAAVNFNVEAWLSSVFSSEAMQKTLITTRVPAVSVAIKNGSSQRGTTL